MHPTPPALVTVAGGTALWWWWRRHPTSRPFAQRLWVDTPSPPLTHARLRRALRPSPGERLLEVGVGSGRYAVPVAEVLGSSGRLDAVDLHDDMLALTSRRAKHQGITQIAPIRGDVAELPYDADTFDGAYLISMLGQVPDPIAALVELARVVRPGGRVVVGELAYDPHCVFFSDLCRRAASAGLRLDTRVGSRVGYCARFTTPG